MNLKGLYWYTESLNFEWRLHNTTLTMSCWLLSPSLDGSLLESFPEILFTCQMALRLTLAEGFICDKPDKRTHLLPHCLCWYQGSELRQGQCGLSLLLPPAAQADSQLQGPHADHQGRACWHERSPPGVAMLQETPTRPLHVPVDGFLASRAVSSLPTTLLGWQNTI